MTQISFRSMVEGEINNSNIMEAGRFILELVKIEKIAKNLETFKQLDTHLSNKTINLTEFLEKNVDLI